MFKDLSWIGKEREQQEFHQYFQDSSQFCNYIMNMVIECRKNFGEDEVTYNHFVTYRKSLCFQWTMLPQFSDTPHFETLSQFQQLIEMSEMFHVLSSLKKEETNLEIEQTLKEIINSMILPLNLQRERFPSKCENIFVWKDILDLRSIQHTFITNDKNILRNLTDIIWNKLQIAKQA